MNLGYWKRALGVGLFCTTVGAVIPWAQPAVAAEHATLTIAITSDPRSLAPVTAGTFFDWVVGYRMHSSLFQADENFVAAPDLAESWDISDDNLTYTFHLNPNARFHDGSPVTSEDVAYSIQEIALVHVSICARGLASVVETIETPDDHTLVVNLSSPYPDMLNPYDGIGPHCSSVVKKELYEGTDIQNNPNNFDPIGSGPFKFVEWVRGSHVVLERNDDYHGTRPALDRVVFRVIGEPVSRSLAFEKGEVDWVPFVVPSSDVARLDAIEGNKVFFHGSPCGSIPGLGFNTRIDPLVNVDVRRALTAAINKQKIVNLVYFGGADVGIGHVPLTPFSAWWHNEEAQQIAYDPDAAAEMLDTAGLTADADGVRLRITLKHTTGYTEHLKIAELIKDDLSRAGVEVNIVSLDNAAWHEHVFKNWDFEVTIVPFCGGPTPATMKRYHSGNVKKISWANAMGFMNDEYDEVFDTMIKETDQDKRLEFSNRLQEILVEQQPTAFLIHAKNSTAVKVERFGGTPDHIWTLGYLWTHLDQITLD